MARTSTARGAAAIFAVAAAASLSAADRNTNFDAWRTHFGRSYATDEELSLRRATWERNRRVVEEHNAKGTTWTMAMTAHADLANEEFAARRAAMMTSTSDAQRRLRTPVAATETEEAAGTNSTGGLRARALQSSVNWYTSGAAQPSVDGLGCNSAYASAAVGAVEGAYKIAHGTLYMGSVQEIVDCTGAFGNYGCSGGDPYNTLGYLQVYGVSSGASGYYEYTGSAGTCQASSYSPVITAASAVAVSTYSISAMMYAVAASPVINGIYTGTWAIQMYGGGIITDPYYCDGTAYDNYWLNVGYGVDSGTDYWIVRSDWGTSYGESGFVRIARTTDFSGAGLCGILRYGYRATA